IETDVRDLDDIRVPHAVRGPCLVEKPQLAGLVAEIAARHHLERHLTADLEVLGAVDRGHRASTEPLRHTVVSKPRKFGLHDRRRGASRRPARSTWITPGLALHRATVGRPQRRVRLPPRSTGIARPASSTRRALSIRIVADPP